jgi:hypothetical protein
MYRAVEWRKQRRMSFRDVTLYTPKHLHWEGLMKTVDKSKVSLDEWLLSAA